jgi:hypothetical protein
VLDAAALVFAFDALSRLSGRGVVRYGIVWNRGCNEFELVSLGVAGIDDAGTDKRAWVEVGKLATPRFVAVASRLAGCSIDAGAAVERGEGRWLGGETRIVNASRKKREGRGCRRGRGCSGVLALGTGGLRAFAGLVVTREAARRVLLECFECRGPGNARYGARVLALLCAGLRNRLLWWGNSDWTQCYRSWRRDGVYQRGTASEAAAVCAAQLEWAL